MNKPDWAEQKAIKLARRLQGLGKPFHHEVVEECAKVAEHEVGSTRREIAAAIRRLKEEG